MFGIISKGNSPLDPAPYGYKPYIYGLALLVYFTLSKILYGAIARPASVELLLYECMFSHSWLRPRSGVWDV